MSILIKIKKISALTFENISYDLCIKVGFVNVKWRTPGPDGGRDIEANYIFNDAIGEKVIQKWYIECKRYQSSINWPVIFEKLSYATADKVDHLLIISTAYITPNCLSKIDQWNAQNNYPKIRHLSSHELENKLKEHPEILIKYGLVPYSNSLQKSFYYLSLIAAKYTQTSLSSTVFKKHDDNYLETANSILELLSFKLLSLEDSIRSHKTGLLSKNELFDWLAIDGNFKTNEFDKYGFRAITSILRVVSRSKNVRLLTKTPKIIELTLENQILENQTLKRDLMEIMFWSNFESDSFSGSRIICRVR